MLKHMCLLASNILCPPSKSVLKVAAVFWPQNWSQKYEGRLSAFILLGPLSWPEYGRYFLALFENRLGPRKWPITFRFPKAQKTIEPILEADDPPFSRNAQGKTSHLRHAPLHLGPSWEPPGASWGLLVASWGFLGASWRLWCLLGTSWGLLGTSSWCLLGPPGNLLGPLVASWELPGASWNLLGPLGTSWELLGVSWEPLLASWESPGASWGLLGASWGLLVLLGASWDLLGPPGNLLGPLGTSWEPPGASWVLLVAS